MVFERREEQVTARLTLDEKLALLMMATDDRQSESAWMRTAIRKEALARGLWPPRPNPRVEVLSEGKADK